MRVPLQSRIRHSLYQAVGAPVFEENSSVDLSSSGISFETSREYPTGTLVLLDVHLTGEPLKLLVCVARIEPIEGTGQFRVGAELIAIDPLQKKKMAQQLGRLMDDFLKSKSEKKLRSKKNPKKKAPSKRPVKTNRQTTLSKKKRKKISRGR
jgi:hypothetical protein